MKTQQRMNQPNPETGIPAEATLVENTESNIGTIFIVLKFLIGAIICLCVFVCVCVCVCVGMYTCVECVGWWQGVGVCVDLLGGSELSRALQQVCL